MVGRELVSSVLSGDSAIAASVSANPTTWVGTRIAGIAQQYSSFQPNKLKLEFVPSVAATESGLVVIGTNWDDGNLDTLSIRSLSGTNGGTSGNVYKSLASVPSLVGLRQPRFLTDLAKPESEPFRFVVVTDGVTTEKVVGHVYVSYDFECFNPSPASTFVVDTGLHDVTLDAVTIGAPIIVSIPDDEEPSSVIFTEDLIESGETVLKAGVRYVCEATATVGKYALKLAFAELRAQVAVAAPAVVATFLYSVRRPALGFR